MTRWTMTVNPQHRLRYVDISDSPSSDGRWTFIMLNGEQYPLLYEQEKDAVAACIEHMTDALGGAL